MKRRYGREWKRIRDRYIKAHPLCEECLKNHRTIAANEVHHIIPLSKGGDSTMIILCLYAPAAIAQSLLVKVVDGKRKPLDEKPNGVITFG